MDPMGSAFSRTFTVHCISLGTSLTCPRKDQETQARMDHNPPRLGFLFSVSLQADVQGPPGTRRRGTGQAEAIASRPSWVGRYLDNHEQGGGKGDKNGWYSTGAGGSGRFDLIFNVVLGYLQKKPKPG